MKHQAPVRGGTPWGAILSILTALFYGASPIDLIPDILPLIGWVDDGIIVPLLLIIGIVKLRRSRQQMQPARVRVYPPKN